MEGQCADISNAATTAVVAENTTKLLTGINVAEPNNNKTDTGEVTQNDTNTTTPNTITKNTTDTKFTTKSDVNTDTEVAIYTTASAR